VPVTLSKQSSGSSCYTAAAAFIDERKSAIDEFARSLQRRFFSGELHDSLNSRIQNQSGFSTISRRDRAKATVVKSVA